jgi:hypothetical protein
MNCHCHVAALLGFPFPYSSICRTPHGTAKAYANLSVVSITPCDTAQFNEATPSRSHPTGGGSLTTAGNAPSTAQVAGVVTGARNHSDEVLFNP